MGRDGKNQLLPAGAFTAAGNFADVFLGPKGQHLARLRPNSVDDSSTSYGVFDSQGKLLSQVNVPMDSTWVAFTPKQNRVLGALASPPRLFLLNLDTGRMEYLSDFDSVLLGDVNKNSDIKPFGTLPYRMGAFTKDDRYLAVSTNRLLVLDLTSKRVLHEERSVYQGYEKPPSDLNFSPDGDLLVFSVRGSNTSRLEIRETKDASRKVSLEISLPGAFPLCHTFDPEGKRLLVIEGKQNSGEKPEFWAREFHVADLLKE